MSHRLIAQCFRYIRLIRGWFGGELDRPTYAGRVDALLRSKSAHALQLHNRYATELLHACVDTADTAATPVPHSDGRAAVKVERRHAQSLVDAHCTALMLAGTSGTLLSAPLAASSAVDAAQSSLALPPITSLTVRATLAAHAKNVTGGAGVDAVLFVLRAAKVIVVNVGSHAHYRCSSPTCAR